MSLVLDERCIALFYFRRRFGRPPALSRRLFYRPLAVAVARGFLFSSAAVSFGLVPVRALVRREFLPLAWPNVSYCPRTSGRPIPSYRWAF